MRIRIEEAIEQHNAQKTDPSEHLNIKTLAEILYEGANLSEGMKRRYVTDMNVGKRRKPKPEELVKIAEILEVSTDFLLDVDK